MFISKKKKIINPLPTPLPTPEGVSRGVERGKS
jgi:hypothetical protein